MSRDAHMQKGGAEKNVQFMRGTIELLLGCAEANAFFEWLDDNKTDNVFISATAAAPRHCNSTVMRS